MRNGLNLSICFFATIILIAFCLTVPVFAKQGVPAQIESVGAAGEDIYDAVKAGDWIKARKLQGELNKTLAKLPSGKKEVAEKEPELRKSANALEKAIKLNNKVSAMESANNITLIAAEMSKPYQTKVPVEVSLLDYYGRELELNAESKDKEKLSSIKEKIHWTWEKLRPDVESHGGRLEAEKFGHLLKRLRVAASGSDYSRLSASILDEVDNLEKIFLHE